MFNFYQKNCLAKKKRTDFILVIFALRSVKMSLGQGKIIGLAGSAEYNVIMLIRALAKKRGLISLENDKT